jgi:hypothetical protein
MTYTLREALSFGTSKTGLTDLRAQLVDDAGVNTGSPISTGFTEIGSGLYWWTATMTDAFDGGAKFYSNATPGTILGMLTIAPLILEGSITRDQAQRIILAAAANKSHGGGTATVGFQDVAGSKDRIAATLDANGNRVSVTLDGA